MKRWCSDFLTVTNLNWMVVFGQAFFFLSGFVVVCVLLCVCITCFRASDLHFLFYPHVLLEGCPPSRNLPALPFWSVSDCTFSKGSPWEGGPAWSMAREGVLVNCGGFRPS